MAKAQYNIRIENSIWDRIQELYPRQASPLIEEYFKELLDKETIEGISREDIIKNLGELKAKKLAAEREEIVLQKKLISYDDVIKKRKELLTSEESEQQKEDYFKLNPELRIAFGELLNELERLKIRDFGYPFVPFSTYFTIKDEEIDQILTISKENPEFILNNLALKVRRLRNKED